MASIIQAAIDILVKSEQTLTYADLQMKGVNNLLLYGMEHNDPFGSRWQLNLTTYRLFQWNTH